MAQFQAFRCLARAAAGLFFLLLLLLSSTLANPVPRSEKPDIRVERDEHGAVTSQSAVCSQIGIDVMKDGGNAVDAIIATTLCIGTNSLYHSGIGGGGFALVRSPNGTFEFVDFREVAPAAAFESMFDGNSDGSKVGGLASAVPGELRGLEYLHRRYGMLPWERLFAPAIRMARHGFNVTDDFVFYMDAIRSGNAFLTDDPAWAIDFAPNGTRVKAGDTMTRRRYANTLETIARQGAGAFYGGNIADATIRALRQRNGTMTLADLADYRIVLREPLQMRYRGFTITTSPAPASGAVVLSIMNTLLGYDDVASDANLNLTTHRFVEAMRFAYGQRGYLGDPAYVAGVQSYEKRMFSDATGKAVRARISDEKTQDAAVYNPEKFDTMELPSTSHLTAADRSGLTISMTSTVNLLFGSHIMVPETGIVLNNQMDDFSKPGISNAFGFAPAPQNFVRAGKRPLSSIATTIVTMPALPLDPAAPPAAANASHPDDHHHSHDDTVSFPDQFYLATGSAGGSRIISAVAQVLWRALDRRLPLQPAVAAPRLHNQLQPGELEIDDDYDAGVAAYLRARGHNLTRIVDWASANAVRRLPNGTFEAARETRQRSSGGFAF